MAKATAKKSTTQTDPARIPVLVALAEMPHDVFTHAVSRLAGLDRHLNDVVRGLEQPSSDAAAKLDAAVNGFLNPPEPPAEPAAPAKAKKASAKKKSAAKKR